MKPKLIIYIFVATISSLLVTGFKDVILEKPFFLGAIIFLLIHSQSYKLYSSLLGSIKKYNLTNGLILSIIISLPLLYFISTTNLTYEKQIRDDIKEIIDVSSYLMPLTYLISIFICFLFDSFFNKETKKINKWRVVMSSSLFYISNYLISFIIALIIAGAQALSFS